MRLVIEAFGRRVIDLELLAPVHGSSPHPAAGAAVPAYDPRSTTGAHIEQGDDGVRGFGFGLVVRARDGKEP